MIIVDEAHHLKNRKTVAWNFVNKLDKNSILLLTATPIQNNLEKLRSLVADVMVRNKRSDVDIKFTKRYAKTIEVRLSPIEKKFYDLF